MGYGGRGSAMARGSFMVNMGIAEEAEDENNEEFQDKTQPEGIMEVDETDDQPMDEQPVNDQTVKLSDQPTEMSDNQPGVSEVIPEVVEEPTDDQAPRKTLKWSDKPKDDQPTEISDNQDEQKAEDSKEKAKKSRREIMREKMKARLSKKADEYRDDDGQSNDARVSSAI